MFKGTLITLAIASIIPLQAFASSHTNPANQTSSIKAQNFSIAGQNHAKLSTESNDYNSQGNNDHYNMKTDINSKVQALPPAHKRRIKR